MADNPYLASAANYAVSPNTSLSQSYLNMFMNAYNKPGAAAPNFAGVGLGQYNPGAAGMGMWSPGNAGTGMYDVGNTGTGQYDIGTAGLGMWNPGNAGMGTYDVGTAGLGMYPGSITPYDVGSAGLGQWQGGGAYDIGNAGQGTYSSALLDSLTGRVQSNLTNPNASLAMGLARDRITGAGQAAQQSLADTFAGSQRAPGVFWNQSSALQSDLAKQQSDAIRDIALQTEAKAIADAQALEQLKGTFYESGKGRELQSASLKQDAYNQAENRGVQAYQDALSRELQNASLGLQSYQDAQNKALQAYQDAKSRELQNVGLGLQAYEYGRQGSLENAKLSQSGYESALARELQNAGLGAQTYEQAQGRALQNAQLGSQNYQDAMLRALQNAGLSQTGYENAQSRALQNAGLSQSGYEAAQNRALQNAQLLADIWKTTQGQGNQNLGTLANMLQWAGNQNTSGEQQTFQNYLALAQMYPELFGMGQSGGSMYGNTAAGLPSNLNTVAALQQSPRAAQLNSAAQWQPSTLAQSVLAGLYPVTNPATGQTTWVKKPSYGANRV